MTKKVLFWEPAGIEFVPKTMYSYYHQLAKEIVPSAAMVYFPSQREITLMEDFGDMDCEEVISASDPCAVILSQHHGYAEQEKLARELNRRGFRGVYIELFTEETRVDALNPSMEERLRRTAEMQKRGIIQGVLFSPSKTPQETSNNRRVLEEMLK